VVSRVSSCSPPRLNGDEDGIDLADVFRVVELERPAFLVTLDIFLDHPVHDLPLKADELALQERLDDAGGIAPGVDAVPFCAGFVLAQGAPLALVGANV